MRTTVEILKDLQYVRGQNRALYQQLEAMGSTLDDTMQAVVLAYAVNPVQAASIHLRILANDTKNREFTQEYIAVQKCE